VQSVANVLLSSPQDEVVLHGDLHHGNILDFGTRGWLAIDPKGLLGERGFDYANIFTNPDLAEPTRPVAIEPKHSHNESTLCLKSQELNGNVC
jgi:streptomycin 6-kinase